MDTFYFYELFFNLFYNFRYAYFIFKNKKNKKIVLCSIILFILFTFELIYKLYIYHPYQSLYLNNFVSKNSKSLYEADYQSLSRFNGILDILNDSKKNNITIATASWTPLKNAISLIYSKNKTLFYWNCQ